MSIASGGDSTDAAATPQALGRQPEAVTVAGGGRGSGEETREGVADEGVEKRRGRAGAAADKLAAVVAGGRLIRGAGRGRGAASTLITAAAVDTESAAVVATETAGAKFAAATISAPVTPPEDAGSSAAGATAEVATTTSKPEGAASNGGKTATDAATTAEGTNGGAAAESCGTGAQGTGGGGGGEEAADADLRRGFTSTRRAAAK